MISTTIKNSVLNSLAEQLAGNANRIITANMLDVKAYQGADESMLDRLKVDSKKVAGMIASVKDAIILSDPEGILLYQYEPENGLKIENRTVPFGNILIIYESRPDVTIEAAITAFKAGNKILLKGGKEARNTNLVLVDLWHQALSEHGLTSEYVQYLDLNRAATQDLIKHNT